MAHYAFIDENLMVVEVMVGRNEDEIVEGIDDWEQYYSQIRGMRCVRASYNTRGGVYYDSETGEPHDDQTKAFRKNYPGHGFSYDEERDAFIPEQPFPSWTLNEDTCLWEAPIARPADGLAYSWDETLGDWVEIQEPSA